MALAFSTLCLLSAKADDVNTRIKYLSGRGCDDMVPWDFYCTDGLNSGKWTKIGVPSCWDVQGFGHTQYGYSYNTWNMFPATAPVADETGYYKYAFTIPQDWAGKQVEIVFEASMTDTEVKINGQIAGERHQGGFSPFRYDVTDKLRWDGSANLLEVKVDKESSNRTMNLAQRRCDFWNFGGIIRPVYLVAKPESNIERVAINAGMDGRFHADCLVRNAGDGWTVRTTILDQTGKKVRDNRKRVGEASLCSPSFALSKFHLWTAETPYLYTAVFSLVNPEYRSYLDEAKFKGFTLADSGRLVCHYEGGCLQEVVWTFAEGGDVKVDVKYRFNKVVDLMGVMFDYPESQVLTKSWLGNGPYRVWQNRWQGPQYGYWHNEYNNPIPGETG